MHHHAVMFWQIMKHRIIQACAVLYFKSWDLSNGELATVQETDIGEKFR